MLDEQAERLNRPDLCCLSENHARSKHLFLVKSLEMLDSEEGQLNAVFACFGSAAQHGQFFEAALSEFLLAYNRLLKKTLTIADLDAVETSLHKKTMGALLSDFRKHVKISDDTVAASLSDALRKRNFLIHYYFRQRQDMFATERGRLKMLAELVSISDVLEKAADLTNGMRVALRRALEDDVREVANSEVLFSIEVDTTGGDQ